MATKHKKSFLKRSSHTSQRREYVDYDYADKLSETEKDWLSQFTQEYYCADFQINETFITIEDLRIVLTNILKTEENSTLIYKYNNLLKSTEQKSSTYKIQVSGNVNLSQNVDLRKLRSITKYYKDENGNLTDDIQYKYKNPIHNIKKYLKDCNGNSIASGRDLICNGYKTDSDDVLMDQMSEDGPEVMNKIYLYELLSEAIKIKE